MIVFAIVFIVLACLMYSISIWTEKFIRELKLWIVILFSIGFLSDLIGTSIMFLEGDANHIISIHAICGYFALSLMFLHLIWAILAKVKRGNYQIFFNRYSLVAWIVWMAAFITGIPKH